MTSATAIARLTEERKSWRRDHPYGFTAKPMQNADGTLDMLNWECLVPGLKSTVWEGGLFKLIMTFPKTYPVNPPIIRFKPPLFHLNVYPSGMICLSILNIEEDWRPAMTIKQILLGVQVFLNEPNILSPANHEAHAVMLKSPKEYEQRIKEQVEKNKRAMRPTE